MPYVLENAAGRRITINNRAEVTGDPRMMEIVAGARKNDVLAEPHPALGGTDGQLAVGLHEAFGWEIVQRPRVNREPRNALDTD